MKLVEGAITQVKTFDLRCSRRDCGETAIIYARDEEDAIDKARGEGWRTYLFHGDDEWNIQCDEHLQLPDYHGEG